MNVVRKPKKRGAPAVNRGAAETGEVTASDVTAGDCNSRGPDLPFDVVAANGIPIPLPPGEDESSIVADLQMIFSVFANVGDVPFRASLGLFGVHLREQLAELVEYRVGARANAATIAAIVDGIAGTDNFEAFGECLNLLVLAGAHRVGDTALRQWAKDEITASMGRFIERLGMTKGHPVDSEMRERRMRLVRKLQAEGVTSQTKLTRAVASAECITESTALAFVQEHVFGKKRKRKRET